MQSTLRTLIFLLAISSCIQMNAQEVVYQTFKDRRVINSHSVEMLPGKKMDFRVGHRFGDILGSSGGWQTFYGLENSSDIFIGLDMGITNNLNVGLSRTKGDGDLKQNINGFLKYRIMQQQSVGSNPLSIVFLAKTSVSTMPKSQSEGVLNSFPKSTHRMAHHLQFMVARKFGNAFSFQANASWTYRNLVYNYDTNDLVSLGFCSRIKLTNMWGLIVDANFPISNLRTVENDYHPAIGIGLEMDTGGGHAFQINLTNATGLSETDYIPYTQTSWMDGEFRLGFTISRIFNY